MSTLKKCGAAALLLLCAACAFAETVEKYTFTFPSYERRGTKSERRAVYIIDEKSDVRAFIEELLLGPETYRSRPLFSLGTQVEFCIEKNRTLYVGLSEELLSCAGNAIDIADGFDFFRRNVLRNFAGRIDRIEIFVGGKETFVWNQEL